MTGDGSGGVVAAGDLGENDVGDMVTNRIQLAQRPPGLSAGPHPLQGLLPEIRDVMS
jgi:hypothetical protein